MSSPVNDLGSDVSALERRAQNAERQRLGRKGEQLAAEFLSARGYREHERNFRCRGGEVDVIAWDGETLCFVEVRCRASDTSYDPLESIDNRKIRRVVRAAGQYLSRLPEPWPEVRFDAVGVVMSDPPRITLVQEAFEA